jgi:hypothetical protein
MGLFGGSQDGAGRMARTAEAQQKLFQTQARTAEKQNMGIREGYDLQQSILKDRLDDGYYYRNGYAELGDGQKRSIEGLKDYFEDGQGYQLLNRSGKAAIGMAGAGANYGQNADQVFNQTGQLANKLSGSATNDIQKRIGQYANDPTLEAAIRANQANTWRGLQENALPGIDIDAAGSGNLDSSRTGIAAGIAMRGASEQAGQIDAQLRNQNMARAQQLAMSDYFGANDQALAANRQLNVANEGVGRAFGAGQLGAQNQAQMQQGVFDAKMGASSYYQQDKQGKINGQREQMEWNNGGRNQQYLNDYMGTFGQGPSMQMGGGYGGGAPAAGGGGFAAKAGGVMSGAAAGAQMGSMIMPGWGTAIGAGVGGLAGLFG